MCSLKIQTCFFHLLDNLEKHIEWPNLGSPLTFPVMVPLIVPGAAVYCHNLTRTEPRNCFILFYSPAMLGDIKMHWVDHRAGGRGDMEAAISGFSVKLYGRSPLLVSKGLSPCDTHPSPYKTSVWVTVFVHRDFEVPYKLYTWPLSLKGKLFNNFMEDHNCWSQ